MGKRIRVQRRGRGVNSQYKASTHKRVAPSRYPLSQDIEEYLETTLKGVITKLVHDPGRGSPLALIKFENGKKCYTVVPEGIYEGQEIQMGDKAEVKIGNILPISQIPEGSLICNIEIRPGDGGKTAKASGSYATLVTRTPKGTIIKFPSGKTKYVNDKCRATIGVVSGSGRPEKPFLKAGAKFHLMKAKGHKYPMTRGRAMIAAVHPHGSSKKSARKGTTVSHGAPPGQKVGLIAARGAGRKARTDRVKKKMREFAAKNL
jgi:large subunit ribosomal protein L2